MNKPNEFPTELPSEIPATPTFAEVGRSRPHESAHLHVAGSAPYTDDLPELPARCMPRSACRRWLTVSSTRSTLT